jgi:DNA (cytosine-5)-methyltransferase 1
MRRSSSTAREFTAVDLFSGCGGLTQGLKDAGFRVVAAIEIDGLASQTYALNHPEVQVSTKNICSLGASAFRKKLRVRKGQLDLLAGCPPCQGFSTMRTLNGKKSNRDRRNDLLFEFVRFVKAFRPKAVMMENVPGLADNRRFKEFRAQLERMGYVGDYCVLNAAHFGVPQRRRRLIYMAGMHQRIAFGKPKGGNKTVRETIADLPPAGKSGDPLHDFPERRSRKVKEMIRTIPKNGGGRNDLPARRQLECHKSCDGFKDVYGRMAWDRVAPTITTGCFNPSKGRFLHPAKNRAITLREAALLQGFPRRYKFDSQHGKISVASMIGNALPPPFIKAHALSIRKELNRSGSMRPR